MAAHPKERTRINRALMAEFNISDRSLQMHKLKALGLSPRPIRRKRRLIPPAIARL